MIREAGADKERYLKETPRRFYTPSSADLLVHAFRKWYASSGGLPFSMSETLLQLGESEHSCQMIPWHVIPNCAASRDRGSLCSGHGLTR